MTSYLVESHTHLPINLRRNRLQVKRNIPLTRQYSIFLIDTEYLNLGPLEQNCLTLSHYIVIFSNTNDYNRREHEKKA
jgi:hypothetical protein